MIHVDMSPDGPLFLEEYWNKIKLSQVAPPSFFKVPIDPLEASKEKELTEMIIKLHALENNCITKDKKIILCNDYIHGLYCLVSVMNKSVSLNTPHDPHYLNCLSFTHKLLQGSAQFLINELPNHQTFQQNVNFSREGIFDCSYNWSLYLKEPYCINQPISIFSAGMALGNISSRLGWIIVSDNQLYIKLRDFIERTQLSISAESQQKTLHLMESIFNVYGKNLFKEAREIIENRHAEILRYKFPFKILNQEGIYLWCRGICPAYIKCMPGSHFGVSNEFFRLNIGIKEDDFKKFLRIS